MLFLLRPQFLHQTLQQPPATHRQAMADRWPPTSFHLHPMSPQEALREPDARALERRTARSRPMWFLLRLRSEARPPRLEEIRDRLSGHRASFLRLRRLEVPVQAAARQREVFEARTTAHSQPAMSFRHLHRSPPPGSPAPAEKAPDSAVPATPAQLSLL